MLSSKYFVCLLLQGWGLIFGLVGFSLFAGAIGYHIAEDMSWIDSIFYAALILSGMGPANTLQADGVKIFASLYCLYSGLLLALVFHRIIHKSYNDNIMN